MKTNKNAQERFFQSCKIGDLNTIKTDLFYNVSPFCQDKVIVSYFYTNWNSKYLLYTIEYKDIIKLLTFVNIKNFFFY